MPDVSNAISAYCMRREEMIVKRHVNIVCVGDYLAAVSTLLFIACR